MQRASPMRAAGKLLSTSAQRLKWRSISVMSSLVPAPVGKCKNLSRPTNWISFLTGAQACPGADLPASTHPRLPQRGLRALPPSVADRESAGCVATTIRLPLRSVRHMFGREGITIPLDICFPTREVQFAGGRAVRTRSTNRWNSDI